MPDLYTLGLSVSADPAVAEMARFQAAATATGQSGAAAGQKFSTGFNAAAQSGAREAARTFATQFAAQYEADKARIQEGLVRGLLTPQQAQQAGRDAALAYNQGLLSQLDRLGGSGLSAGNSAAYRELADSLKPIGPVSDTASLGLGRLRYSMTALVDSAAGLPPIVGRVVSSFGGVALGLAPLLELLATIAALAEAWKYVQGPANDTNKAIESTSESARDAYRNLVALNQAMLGLNAVKLGEPTAELSKLRDEVKKLTGDLGGDLDAGSLRTFANAVRDLFRDAATNDGSVQFQLTIGHLNELYKTGHLSLQQYTQDVIELVKQNPAIADLAAQYLKQAGALQGVIDKMADLKAAYNARIAQQSELGKLYGDPSLAKLGQQTYDLGQQYRALTSGGQGALDVIVKSQAATRDAAAAWAEYVTVGDGVAKTFRGVTLAHYTYTDAVKLGIPAVAQFKIAADQETAAALRQEAALKAVAIARGGSSSTGQNAASVQAAENEYNLVAAANANKLADQEAAEAATHRWSVIATGSKSEQDLVVATQGAAAADIAATSALRDRETALAKLKAAQDAQAQVEAAGVALRTALIGADAQEAAAARARYSDTINAIDQQHTWRDAQIDATDATNRQVDANTRAANNTAFTDAIAANIARLQTETAALHQEALAKQQGQDAVDALAVSLAGEAAVRALVIAAAKEHVTVTEDEITATRQAAEAHEKAAQAVQHASEAEKEFANVGKNFIRNLQSDVGSFFENLFDGGTNAAQRFWQSFEQLALKTFGELAAKDLMQSVIKGAHGQGALGGLLGGFGSPRTGAPSASDFGVDAGTGISDFTGAGSTAGGGFNLGVFAAATAGVFTVTDGLNHLLGVTLPTAAGLKQFADNVIAIGKSLQAYQLSVGGSSVAQQLAQNQASADSIRQNIESTYAGKRNQGVREELLGQVGQAQAQGYQKIAEEFFDGVRSAYNATLGPAGQYQNELDAAAEKYIADTKAAKDLGAGQEALDQISQTYTNTVNTLTAAYKENLAQTQLALDARLAAAQGDTVAAAAIQRRAEEEKQLFDAQQQGYTAAQIDELKHIQALEDEAAAAARAAAALQAFRDATNTLAKNLAAGPGGTAASAAAANLQPLLDKQATDTATAAASAQRYAEDLAHGADAATLAADRQQFLTDATVAMGDAAAIAAQQFQDAVAAIQQGTSDIENAVSGGFITGAAGIAAERQQFGFVGLSDADIRALYTDPTKAGGLTNEERERNREIDQFLKDEGQWGPSLASSAAALASGGAGANANLQTTAISSAAGGLTQVTGNRMADFLESLNVHAIEIRDAILGRSPLGGAFAGPTVNPFGPTPSFPSSSGADPFASVSARLDALTTSLGNLAVGAGTGGTVKVEVTVRGDDPFAVQRVVQQLRPALDKAVNEDLGKLLINIDRSQGVNVVGGSRGLVGG